MLRTNVEGNLESDNRSADDIIKTEALVKFYRQKFDPEEQEDFEDLILHTVDLHKERDELLEKIKGTVPIGILIFTSISCFILGAALL